MNRILEKQFDRITRTYLKNCKTLQKRITKKSVHSLRVSTKRIQALLQYIEFVSDGKMKPGDELKKLRKIFKKAGVIRNRHIQMGLLKEQYPHKKILQKVNSGDKQDKEHLRKVIKDSHPAKIFKTIDKQIKAVRDYDKNELLQNAYRFTEETLEDALKKADDKDYHKARIRLKRAHYVLEMFHRQQEVKGIINLIHPLETDLGGWHDQLILLESLEKFYPNDGDQSIKVIMYQIKDSLKKQELKLDQDFENLKENSLFQFEIPGGNPGITLRYHNRISPVR